MLPLPNELPDRLRTARQSKRLTLAKLGAALNPPRGRTAVCEWEQGRCEPSLATIEQLAAALGVTPCWLAFGSVCPRSAVGCRINAMEQADAK